MNGEITNGILGGLTGGMLGVFGGFFIIMFIIMLAIAVAVYILCAIGYKKALTYFGHKNTWMAFVPILNSIALAQCITADEENNVSVFGITIKKSYFILFPALQFIISFIPAIGSLLSFAIGLIGFGITFKDLLSRSNYKGDSTVLAWISAVFSIVWIVLCYMYFKGTEPVAIEVQPEIDAEPVVDAEPQANDE